MSAKSEHRAAVVARTRKPRCCALRHRGGCRGELQADHVVEIAWLAEWLRRSPVKCSTCGGTGQHLRETFAVEPVCCGRTRPDGDCCGIPVPESVLSVDPVPCRDCGATGRAPLDQLVADGRNGWLLCERHHGLKTAALLTPPIERRELPPCLDGFLSDFDCAHLLDGRAAFAR